MISITKKQFRQIILLQAGLILVSAIAPFVIPEFLNPEAADVYVNYFSEPALSMFSVIMAILSIPFMVWAFQNMVALYLFRPYAPRHLLYITGVGLVLGLSYDPLGVLPITGIESVITFAYTALGGATLALVFTSNVAEFFRADEVAPAAVNT